MGLDRLKGGLRMKDKVMAFTEPINPTGLGQGESSSPTTSPSESLHVSSLAEPPLHNDISLCEFISFFLRIGVTSTCSSITKSFSTENSENCMGKR